MVVQKGGDGVGAIGLAGKNEAVGAHQAYEVSRVRRRRPERCLDDLRHDESDVSRLVEHVQLGVDSVLGFDRRQARVGKERRDNHVTCLDPGHEQSAIGIGVHVEAVGEHDHGVRAVAVSGRCPSRHGRRLHAQGRIQDLDLHDPAGSAGPFVEILCGTLRLRPGRARQANAEGGGRLLRSLPVAHQARGRAGGPLGRLRATMSAPGRYRARRQGPGGDQKDEGDERSRRASPWREHTIPPSRLGLHDWQIYRRSGRPRRAPSKEIESRRPSDVIEAARSWPRQPPGSTPISPTRPTALPG